MDHIAILAKAKVKKGDNLLADILSGAKTIESRWYVNKVAPWGKIDVGDRVYFKESGGLVSAVAGVSKVLQFENLNDAVVLEILKKFGNSIAPNTSKAELLDWAKTQKNKRYCILIFLKNVQKVKPFEINKEGFGCSCAWLVVGDIGRVRL